MKVRAFAPAKINLTLQVARPRADGMHELQSAVTFADVGDWVTAEAADELSLTISGPFAQGLSGENLITKAAEALAAGRGAKLTLEKNLPVASGIGGGSTDAAAAIRALNSLWELELSEERTMRIAATLGSDVPVCVAARSAWMTGVGEVVAAMQTPPLSAVLINPGRPLATPSVFKQFDLMGLGGSFSPAAPPRWNTTDEALSGIAALGNDLEAPAVALMAEIGEIAHLLRSDPRVAYAALSGSGATLFALTHSAEAAHALASDLSTRRREWWVRAVRLAALDAAALRG